MVTKKDVSLVLAIAAVFCLLLLWPKPSHAQGVTSLLDPSRLSVGARVYRSFDEKPSVAGSFSSGWWAGVPMAWELTSPHDPAVKLPVSIIAALDIGIPAGDQKQTFRGYIGLGFLLKRSGQ